MAIPVLACLVILAAPAAETRGGGAGANAPPPGGSSAGPKPPSVTFTGKKFPPPGSPEDQALLGRLLRENASMLSERARAITATQRLKDAALEEKLAAVARQEPERAPGLDALRERLRADWNRVAEIMTRIWPVSPRVGCRPQGLQLEVVMGERPGTQGAARLPASRESARFCLERLLVALEPLRSANRALDATVADVRAALDTAILPTSGDAGRGPPAGAGGSAQKPP